MTLMSWRIKGWISISLLFLCGTLAGCGVSKGETASGPSTAPEGSESRPKVIVSLGEFSRGDIESRLSVAADLEAVRSADVYPEVSGIIVSVLVREGDRVSSEDPVIRLKDDDAALAEQNRAILLEQKTTQFEQAKLAVDEAQAQIEQRQLLLEQSQREFERLSALSAEDVDIVSPEQLDAKRYERDQREIDLRSARLSIEKKKLERDQAEQSMRLADVDVKTARLNLERSVIRSPIDGYISELDLNPGETVSLAAPVFTVVDPDHLRARLHVPQRELSRLEEGQRVSITSEVYAGREFEGSVAVINPVIDKSTGTVRVIVEIGEHGGLLRPGMFVSGEVILDTHTDAVLVPKKAVTYENQEPIVFLVRDGIAHRYVLKPGYSSRSFIEVGGLVDSEGRPGDPADGQLVLVGNNLKHGDPVDVVSGAESGSP
ncbi:MAG: efflux RND transporter periplasmic adaptor subunit [Planctomycetes bacterium]|nr:efflux RND transporter periplasmic adaptor subunit [Planctomycetota bacterium]